jgi:hypothetical protein
MTSYKGVSTNYDMLEKRQGIAKKCQCVFSCPSSSVSRQLGFYKTHPNKQPYSPYFYSIMNRIRTSLQNMVIIKTRFFSYISDTVFYLAPTFTDAFFTYNYIYSLNWTYLSRYTFFFK